MSQRTSVPPPFLAGLKPGIPPKWDRFIGLDVHKFFITIVVIDREFNTLLTVNKVTWAAFEPWCRQNITKSDAVVLEMTTNTWVVHDLLLPLAGEVKIVHPLNIAKMMRRLVKTDKRDAFNLARLYASGWLNDEGVWVPPHSVREIRTLVAQRHRLIGLQTRAKNVLHAVLHRNQLAQPEGSLPFSDKHADFWLNLKGITGSEKVEVRLQWNMLQYVERDVAVVEQHLAEIAGKDDAVKLLVQLPGVALINAITIMAAIGDISRFPKPRQLVGYAGLGSIVQQSSDNLWQGPISKAGRGDLRYTMVDVATHAVDCHPHWKREYKRLQHKGNGKALVAIARQMLTLIWHVLTKVEADKNADPVQVANGYLQYYYQVGREHIPGQPRAAQFVRDALDDLGIGVKVKALTRNKETGKRMILPPSRHDPNAVIERKRDTCAPEYPPFGCASIRAKPDPRTFEERVKSGRSKPEGAIKKRTLVGPRKKVAEPNPTG